MEDKIEIGEYVRTECGLIFKVNEIKYYEEYMDYWCQEGSLLGDWKEDIVKHSKQLIDLIEIGDIVNEFLVLDIDTVLKAGERKALDVGYGNYIFDDEIQTILTKEKFEANCYKVRGE